MEEPIKTIVADIQQTYKAECKEYKNEITLVISKESLLPALKRLKDYYHFNVFIDVTAVDYWPQESPRMHLIYQIYSLEENQLLRLRVPLKSQELKVVSITPLFRGANWYEREVADLFGIQFENHPDPRRIIMPHDWVGYPLRKDYPLGYEEVQFTFNFEEIDLKKPYAKE